MKVKLGKVRRGKEEEEDAGREKRSSWYGEDCKRGYVEEMTRCD